MKLPVPICFEWDAGNLNKNWEKHKVSAKETEEIFLNETLKIFPDPGHSKVEERFVAYGITDEGRRLTVVFTLRAKKTIRPISARDQSKKERRQYEKEESD